MRRALPLLWALACHGGAADDTQTDTDATTTPSETCPDPALTWDTFGRGYVTTWCQVCHASTVTGPTRNGAPTEVTFDTPDDVRAWATTIEAVALGPTATMPPAGGVPAGEAAAFADWLACGAPGEAAPPGPCDALMPGPALAGATQADLDAWCATGANQVAGDLGLGAGAVNAACVCAVDGAVTPSATTTSLALPLLAKVGGTLDLTQASALETLSAPALADVGGDVVAAGAGALATVELPVLGAVGGAMRWEDLGSLPALALPQLYDVGGEVRIADSPALATLALPRLHSTGGSCTLHAVPVAALTLDALESVAGDLELSALPALPTLDTFGALRDVAGRIEVSDNPAITQISGFTLLQGATEVSVLRNAALEGLAGFDTLGTADVVAVSENPKLARILAFENLLSLPGGLALGPTSPALTDISGFQRLDTAGSVHLDETGLLALDKLRQLTAITGDLRLANNDAMVDVPGFDVLATVGGDLEISYNGSLRRLTGFPALTAVGGDVRIYENPLLPAATAAGFAGSLDVNGTVEVHDNGP